MEDVDQTKRPTLKKTSTVILEQNDPCNNNNIQKQRSSVLTRFPSHLSKFDRKQIFNNQGGVNDWLQKFLPYEILLFIFTMLPRQDLASVSRTCKHFRAVTQDAMFAWVTVFKPNFTNYGGSLKSQIVKQVPLTLRSTQKARMTYGERWALFSGEHNVADLYHHIKSTKKTYQGRRKDQREEEKIRDEILRNILACCDAKPSLLRYSAALTPVPTVFAVDFQVHIHSLEAMVRKGENIPILNLILKTVRKEAKLIAESRLTQYVGKKDAKVPLKSNIAPKQPPGLKDGIQLYKYQLDAVKWMTSVEADVAAKVPFKYVPLVPWRTAKTELLFDLRKEIIVPASTLSEQHIAKIYPKGGVLADEMGLGKTIEILGLILSHPQTVQEEADAKTTNTVSVETEVSEDDTQESIDKLRFRSKATMIVCPNHLVQQWHDEFVKFAQNPLKIHLITTANHIKALSHEELAEADIVIVALQLLKYAGYQNLGKAVKKAASTKSKINFKARGPRVASSLKRLRNHLAKGHDADEYPLLEHFIWHRLVIDEAHEVLGDKDFRDIFSFFRSKYSWYVSGTPIPNAEVLTGVLEFLNFPSDEQAQYSQYVYADMFWHNLYWRNTKESVKDEYAVPDVVEDLVLLEFSEVEKVLYKDFDEEDKRKLCSKLHHIGSSKTLSDIKNYKIDEKTRSIKSHRTNLFSLKQELEQVTEKLATTKEELSTKKASRPAGFYFDFAFDNTVNKLQTTIRNLENRKVAIKNSITEHQAGLVREQEFLVLYEGVKTYRDKLAEANKLSRTLSSGVQSPAKKGKNNDNNNNNDDMDTEELPTEKEIANMKATQMKEFLTKHDVTPNSTKAEMEKQIYHVIAFIKHEREESKKRKAQQTDEDVPAKKQKTEHPTPPAEPSDARVESVKELLELVEKLGTKMGNLIYYLKKLWDTSPTSRVIIFSQFDAVLAQVDDILSKNGIQTVSVKGNANQKTEALNSFKDTDSSVKVILLSLAKAASGSNLIQASHVVLIDPITGTKEEVQAVESQAIGRAYRQGQSQHVTVVRFLIKDTEEHAMYIKTITPGNPQDPELPTLNRTGSTLLFRSTSVSAVLGNVPTSDAATIVKLAEEIELQSEQSEAKPIETEIQSVN